MRTERKGKIPLVLVVAFVAFQFLDGLLTTVGVYRYRLELEANPVAALTFARWGVWHGVVAAKALSFAIFFGMLWYCVYVRWTVLDVVGLLWKRKPKRDPAYSMACFNVMAVITTLACCMLEGVGFISCSLFSKAK